ncbi:MAG: hypothetical protein JJ958_11850 [Balneola sp.]|nr:hypothetical protein [Balneola sp.]
MRLVLTISLLFLFASCNKKETEFTLPSIANMKVGESLTYLDYSGHIPFPVGERSNLGAAYKFKKESDSTFTIYKLDPYLENPADSILNSAVIGSKFVHPIDSLIYYHRKFKIESGSCSAVTNTEIIWQSSRSSFTEKYSDITCGRVDYFNELPIMPAIREAGFNQLP